MEKIKKAAVIATGYLGDTIACLAAASSLSEKGYKVTFFIRWPQLKTILDNDTRFKTVVYRKFTNPKIFGWFFRNSFDLIIEEPNGWSYEEPFTSQIRRLADCQPISEYTLKASSNQTHESTPKQKNTVCISRDIVSRAYGRNIQQLVESLEEIATIKWVGLNPGIGSKKGRNSSLSDDANFIAQSNIFIGPEGGLLWLAAGLGTKCIYLTEHIEALAEKIERGNPRKTLGSVNHFPMGPHQALPPYCSNEYVVEQISKTLHELEDK